MSQSSSAKNLSDLGKRSSSITGINKILDNNDTSQSSSTSSEDADDALANDFMKQLDNASDDDNSQSEKSDSSAKSSSANSTQSTDKSSVTSKSSNSQSDEKNNQSAQSEDKTQSSTSTDEDDTPDVNPALQQELAGEAEEEEAKQMIGQAQQQQDAETGVNTQSTEDTSEKSSASSQSNIASSSASSVVSLSNSATKNNSQKNDTASPNVMKQMSLKEYHSFDIGLQRAYVAHKGFIKDAKKLYKHDKEGKSTSKDFEGMLQSEEDVFHNLCNTIYTNRKNYDKHVDIVDKKLQDTKDKASQGADTIQQWKEEGLFANILPYLETISDVASDPRFKQLVQKLDTKDLTPTKKLKKVSEKAEKTGKELATEKAKAGKNNDSDK